MASIRRLAASSAFALVLISACSKSADPSILGHWRVEHIDVYSLQLPVGPDIVVSATEIVTPDTGTSVRVTGIEVKGDTATVDMPYGVGLKFFFDGPDRVYLKAPLVGRVYYRRVVEPARASQPETSSTIVAARVEQQGITPAAKRVSVGVTPTPTQIGLKASGSAGPTTAPVVGAPSQSTGKPGVKQYDRALLAARQGQVDDAIDYLDSALRSGFREFAVLDSAPEMAELRKDVRFQALVARYR
ncbi:TPR end-of-group domain-containing protein [Paraburkholderia azotifigens]|uniref:Tetratricopeptide repeat protein n=1 Tax=Paraburkholderia azotifigens TaxID=2057004 RepID=A0A5C6V2I5_9BURK|nr:hypothetical protein [Paraburkholderia azotifigens]TXC79652.1 hypothetical protein FRZ40_35435 [Paraburkholderia azotifigens]